MPSLYEQFMAAGSVRSLMNGREFIPVKASPVSLRLQEAFEQKPGDTSFKRLKKIQRMIEESPVGREVLEAAKQTGTRFRLDNSLTECSGVYSYEERSILLNAKESDAYLATTMVHEARHAWQAEQAVQLDPSLNVKSFFMTGFAIEADAVAREAYFANDVRGKHPEIWQTLLEDKYAPVAHAFQEGIRRNNMLRDGLDSAFQAWYTVSSVPLYGADYVNFLEKSCKNPVCASRREFLNTSVSAEQLAAAICTQRGETYLRNPAVLESPEKLNLREEDKERLDKALISWAKQAHRSPDVGSDAIFVRNRDGSYTPGKKLAFEKPQANPLWRYPYQQRNGR